jgi:hypothetical protein
MSIVAAITLLVDTILLIIQKATQQINDKKVKDKGDPKQLFPLKDTHDFAICCVVCLIRGATLGHSTLLNCVHQCKKDMLSVRKIGEEHWIRIRPRTDRVTKKTYIRCK